MKKILVTGGFGFLGSHIIEALLSDPENHVHVVDNLSTNPLPLDFLLSIIKNKKHLTYDIKNLIDFNPTESFDEIYHLAAIVGPAGVLKHPGRIVKNTVDDTYHVMDMAQRMDARLLDVSTSEIYGGGRDGFCSEFMSKIIQPEITIRLEYAIAKLASEIALVNKVNSSNLNAVIVRPFNISGPRQSGKGGFVLPRFILQAINNKPLTVFGKGDQVRAFTHVKDVAAGIINAMQMGRMGEAYNIGNMGNKTTILHLAEDVIRYTNSKSAIIFVDPKTIYGEKYAEANDKYPDDTKSGMEIEWKPKFSKRDVIEDTYTFMSSIKDPKILEYLS
ncbi:MAG: NAD-dependent epimerase/dehydratase family protein [Bacteroidetes bacterium]|nr:NAD-dependent epimerase/dehydratase family protein [Bacteroidota bacterium]